MWAQARLSKGTGAGSLQSAETEEKKEEVVAPSVLLFCGAASGVVSGGARARSLLLRQQWQGAVGEVREQHNVSE